MKFVRVKSRGRNSSTLPRFVSRKILPARIRGTTVTRRIQWSPLLPSLTIFILLPGQLNRRGRRRTNTILSGTRFGLPFRVAPVILIIFLRLKFQNVG